MTCFNVVRKDAGAQDVNFLVTCQLSRGAELG